MNEAPTEQPRDQMAADKFKSMSERITSNLGAGFGGALVIIPSDGDPLEMLILDSKHNPTLFWSNVKTMAEIALAELANPNATGRGLGYR